MKKPAIGIAIALGVLSVGAFVLGLVLRNEANFARDYVHDELAARAIAFTPAANLLPSQKGIDCLNDYAEQPLLTGKQAECYAKYQIGLDLEVIDEGKSYFESHYNGYLARVAAAEAQAKAPDDPATAALVQEANDVQRKADDLLAGEATRGLLLTAYAFSVMGDRGMAAAWACFIIAVAFAVGAVISLLLGLRARSSNAPSTVAS